MTIKAGLVRFIVMILFWIYLSGKANRIIRKKNVVTGDWSQSNQYVSVRVTT